MRLKQRMLVVVAYDISTLDKAGQKRLSKVAKICSRYGIRSQNSLFECYISNVDFLSLKKELLEIYKESEDLITFYLVGNSYEGKVEKYGRLAVTSLGDSMFF